MVAANIIPQKRILLVEDNADARESLCTLLKLWGFDVEVAKDGADGVAQAVRWRPDVAVVDIGLPLLDGYQVARRVRDTMRDRIFLIALTAYSQPEDRRRALESGFDVHMGKPADLKELARLLRWGRVA